MGTLGYCLDTQTRPSAQRGPLEWYVANGDCRVWQCQSCFVLFYGKRPHDSIIHTASSHHSKYFNTAKRTDQSISGPDELGKLAVTGLHKMPNRNDASCYKRCTKIVPETGPFVQSLAVATGAADLRSLNTMHVINYIIIITVVRPCRSIT